MAISLAETAFFHYLRYLKTLEMSQMSRDGNSGHVSTSELNCANLKFINSLLPQKEISQLLAIGIISYSQHWVLNSHIQKQL